MEYPRTVILEDGKLKTLLQEKMELVLEGREMSQKIEDVEANMKAIDTEIQTYEKKVDISDLDAKAREITEAMNAIIAQMEGLKKEVKDRIRAGVPDTFYAQYEENEAKKKSLESDRNKTALKIQKKNDKIIPLGQKLMKPHLQDKYEDYDSLRIEDGQIVGSIFSHLAMFNEQFDKRISANQK